MDLTNVLRKYPGARIATQSDNEKILAFYDRSSMGGKGLRIRSVRSPDFFKFLQFQSGEYIPLIIENETGDVNALATVVMRDGYINEELKKVGYLSDFRILHKKEVMLKWRKIYADMIINAAEITEFKGASHFYTCTIDENTLANNALVKRLQKYGIMYEPLSCYQMVNILKKMTPFIKKFPEAWKLKKGSDEYSQKIKTFFENQNKLKPFGFTAEELDRRIYSWPNYNWKNFRFIENEKSEIIACFALWSPSLAKSNVINHLPLSLELLRFLINFPKNGEKLETGYMTALEISHALSRHEQLIAFRILVDSLYRDGLHEKYHILSYCDYPDDTLLPALSGYLTNRVPMKLFEVRNANHASVMLRQHPWIGFEMSLV